MSERKLRITVDGKSYDVRVEILDDGLDATAQPPLRIPAISEHAPPPAPEVSKPSSSPPTQSAGQSVNAPLGGTVVKIHVQQGQSVSSGQTLVTLEAMKMNTDINAPADGTVASIRTTEGATVGEGDVLLELS